MATDVQKNEQSCVVKGVLDVQLEEYVNASVAADSSWIPEPVSTI